MYYVLQQSQLRHSYQVRQLQRFSATLKSIRWAQRQQEQKHGQRWQLLFLSKTSGREQQPQSQTGYGDCRCTRHVVVPFVPRPQRRTARRRRTLHAHAAARAWRLDDL